MATGELTLIEAAKLSQDHLQRGVLETFVQESVVLDRIPFLTIQGNSYQWNREASLPDVAFRDVNEGYVASHGTTSRGTVGLTILGGDADVDRFIVQTRGDLNNQRAIQTALKVKALSYKFQDAFINGNSATEDNAYDGLKVLLDQEVAEGDGTQTIAHNGPVFDAGSEAAAHAFFDKLEELTAAVKGGPSAFYANASTIAKIRSAGRRMGGVEIVREDLTGKRVTMWNGIPVLDLGNRPDGSAILPQDPATGSEIYAVRYGANENDRGVTGLTNGGVQVYDLGELDVKPVYRTRIEFYVGLALFAPEGAARLTGVGAAADEGTGETD